MLKHLQLRHQPSRRQQTNGSQVLTHHSAGYRNLHQWHDKDARLRDPLADDLAMLTFAVFVCRSSYVLLAGGLGSANDTSAGVTYTSSMNVKGELVGHPDYLAVVAVVAAYGWVTPKFLHRLVVALERDMIETEVALTAQQ